MPLAAVLWNSGISFGGVIAFIFADLIVLPILDIYRKYYGRRMAVFLLATFYTAIVAASLLVEIVFDATGLVPTTRTPSSPRPRSTSTTRPSSTSCSWPSPPGSSPASSRPAACTCCA